MTTTSCVALPMLALTRRICEDPDVWEGVEVQNLSVVNKRNFDNVAATSFGIQIF